MEFRELKIAFVSITGSVPRRLIVLKVYWHSLSVPCAMILETCHRILFPAKSSYGTVYSLEIASISWNRFLSPLLLEMFALDMIMETFSRKLSIGAASNTDATLCIFLDLCQNTGMLSLENARFVALQLEILFENGLSCLF